MTVTNADVSHIGLANNSRDATVNLSNEGEVLAAVRAMRRHQQGFTPAPGLYFGGGAFWPPALSPLDVGADLVEDLAGGAFLLMLIAPVSV